jgi:acetolactate synthase small subunit
MLKLVRFVVTAENDPDVLARAVLLLHRLAIPIRALTMIRPERSNGRMHMTIHLKVDPTRTPRIAANLSKIVHVLSVEARDQDPQSAARTERFLAPRP